MTRRAVCSVVIATIALGACGTDDADRPTIATSPAPTTTIAVAATVPTTLSDDPATTASSDAAATSAAPTTAGTVPPAVAPAPTIDLDAVAIDLVEVAELGSPVAMAPQPNGDMLLADQSGLIRSTGDLPDVPPWLDLTDDTGKDGERGLLGLALAPDGASLFVQYTDNDGDSQIEQFAIAFTPDGGTIDASSRRTILSIEQPYANHNGGHLAFGPDGMLYIGTGDGGAANDPERLATDPGSLLGKMLRIDPFSAEPYAVPADNPFIDVDGVRPEIWSLGLRNPWKYSFDRLTGDLWIGDVGQGVWEEIDVVRAAEGNGRGAHYGWSAYEGTHPFNDDVTADPHTPPLLEYEHGDDGCSVTGGYVYRGTAIPTLYGAYVFGDYCSGKIWAIDATPGADTRRVELGDVDDLSSFGEAVDGELYVASAAGPVYQLVPAG